MIRPMSMLTRATEGRSNIPKSMGSIAYDGLLELRSDIGKALARSSAYIGVDAGKDLTRNAVAEVKKDHSGVSVEQSSRNASVDVGKGGDIEHNHKVVVIEDEKLDQRQRILKALLISISCIRGSP